MKIRAVFLSIFLVSCASATDSSDTRIGRYVMRTINGNSLPEIVQELTNSRLTFNAGAVRLKPDMSFTDSTDLTVTALQNGVPIAGQTLQRKWDVAFGVYRLSGDTVYFDSVRDEHYFMVFTATGGMAQDLAGSRLYYSK